jgi:hypothetical protein
MDEPGAGATDTARSVTAGYGSGGGVIACFVTGALKQVKKKTIFK